MKLDYRINHIINNYRLYGLAIYDYITSEIWLRTKELCDIVNTEFGLSLQPKKSENISKETAIKIWKFLSKKYNLTGDYGDKFLNSW